jgi:hybrid cluster-associated redox disulfide protein
MNRKKEITNKITENSTLAEILEKPELIKVLAKYKLPCLGCPLAKYEMENLKIGQVCQMYGINLEDLLKELNKKLK